MDSVDSARMTPLFVMQDIRYTEPVVRESVRRSILRLLGPTYFVALILLGVSVVVGCVRADYDWFLGVIGTVFLQAILIPFCVVYVNTRAALLRFRALECGIACIDLAEGQLRIESKLGRAEIPLKRITHVWRYPDYWVLLTGHSILMTVPIEGVATGVSDAWLHELTSAGVRVN